MAADGVLVIGFHGPVPRGGLWNGAPVPTALSGVRPDAWGILPSGELAIGEAKSADDIATPHTQLQLRVFGHLENSSGRKFRLYLAVPRSAATALDRALAEAGLASADHVVRMHIPDCLIPEDDRAAQ